MQPGPAPKRRNYWTPILVFFLLIFGIFIGFNLNKYLIHKRPITTVIERNDRVEEIIDLVNERYVDSIDKNLLYQDAIQGVLKHLDPHTTYIPSEEMKEVNEKLSGNFKGIGVEFIAIKDTIVITAVIKNGPSQDAGLKIGDKILKIDTHFVAGKRIESAELSRLISGPEDSKIDLSILREGKNSPLKITVKRGLVPLYSIVASYMVDQKIGYIKIERFSATTYREFLKSMETLLQAGMKELVLDLRQNPGGYLDAATAILDEFINDNKLLVYTQGRNSTQEKVFAEKKGIFENGKLIILVNEGSASASEIVAGAVQDWDRGLVIGRRTYGKGLVQEQFTLTDGSALRLTIARYFTPSGRNIQKEYPSGLDSYTTKLMTSTNPRPMDSLLLEVKTDNPKYYTEREHRTVYGGQGIEPDIVVPFDFSPLIPSLLDLELGHLVKTSVFEYYIKNSSSFSVYKNVSDFNRKFSVPEQLFLIFQRNVPEKDTQRFEKAIQNAQIKDFLALQMKALLAKILFGNDGFYQLLNQNDKVMQRSLLALRSNEYSRIIKR